MNAKKNWGKQRPLMRSLLSVHILAGREVVGTHRSAAILAAALVLLSGV